MSYQLIAPSISHSSVSRLSLIELKCGGQGGRRGGRWLIFFLGSTPLVCPFLPARWRLNVSVEKWKI